MTGTVTTTTARARRALHLTKHHGAGNDFLVLVDLEGTAPLDGALVRAACHRRFGIGADGLIRVSSGGTRADLAMDLWNADGSVAEMSGNGIRCLAQAAVEAGVVEPPTFTVWTLAGLRTVDYRPSSAVGVAEASVDMGKATLGPDQPQEFPGRMARQVDMGNPHLVLFGPNLADVDVEQLGTRLQEAYPSGINVEFITGGPGPDAITLRVWERGVGQTQACGTGSAAAAAAAQSWGLVGDRVEVHNPGGVLTAVLATDGIVLSGPVATVAGVDIDPAELLDAART